MMSWILQMKEWLLVIDRGLMNATAHYYFMLISASCSLIVLVWSYGLANVIQLQNENIPPMHIK